MKRFWNFKIFTPKHYLFIETPITFILIFLSLVLLFQNPALSQDKILLISGKTIEGKVLSVATDSIRYEYPFNGKKTHVAYVETFRVFSITFNNGNEKVLYKYDSLTVNDRTEQELRNFIAGEQDALRGYKPAFAGVLGFGISGALAFIINGSFFVILAPVATYIALSFLYRTSIDRSSVRDAKLLSNPDYIEGYKRIAKSKKNRNALWGSFLGAGVGYGVFILSQKDF